jgi:DNA primase
MTDKPSIEEYLNYIGAATPAMGSGWRKMKCPFHDDSHASAAVNYDKNAFVCHGCGIKGDTYSLIMDRERINYREAVQFAASVLTSGNTEVRQQDRTRTRLSVKPSTLGRRGKNISLGSGRRPTSRA